MTVVPCHRCCQTSLIRGRLWWRRKGRNTISPYLTSLHSPPSHSLRYRPWLLNRPAPLMLSLWFTPSLVLWFSFLLSFSLRPVGWPYVLKPPSLTRGHAWFEFLFVKRCLLCTVCQSKAISGLSRLPPPTMSPSVSLSVSALSAWAIIVKRILTRPRRLMNCYSQSSLWARLKVRRAREGREAWWNEGAKVALTFPRETFDGRRICQKIKKQLRSGERTGTERDGQGGK